jgi:hypothetical protein
MDDRILTLHPQGKRGVRISRQKYDVVCAAIHETLRARGDMTFAALGEAGEQRLAGMFDGSVMWYYTSVKLDLEARGVLRRVAGSGAQRIHLAE